jgi:hypothetical protein
MICRFIDAMRAEGHRACADLHCPAFAGSTGRPGVSDRLCKRGSPMIRALVLAKG